MLVYTEECTCRNIIGSGWEGEVRGFAIRVYAVTIWGKSKVDNGGLRPVCVN